MAVTMNNKWNHAVMNTIVILFGVGAWIAINGVWVELPVLIYNPVKPLPEGWGLPSYLVAISQVANIGPLIIFLMQKFADKYYRQNTMIYTILTMGTLSCLLLCFFWDVTTVIAGTEHSIGLFCFFFIISFVDCSSSLTFMPFMTRFQNVFLTTYFIGEGLSGFLPSIVALGQGVSQSYCVNKSFVNTTTNETYYKVVTESTDPRFSVDWFFGFLFIMMVCCSVSFILLNKLSIAKSFRVRSDVSTTSSRSSDICQSSSSEMTSFKKFSHDKNTYKQGTSAAAENFNDNAESTSVLVKPEEKLLTTKEYVYFYFIIFWITCISNGVIPSIISYSSLPYGNLPYHFAATLGAMANPVACFIALFLLVKSHVIVGIFCLIATGFGAFLTILAVQSPCPVLVNSDGGAALMVISQILFVGTVSYAKVSIGQIFRARGHAKSLVWYGAVTQLGSLIGALTMFPLVNIYYFFTSGDSCSTVCP